MELSKRYQCNSLYVLYIFGAVENFFSFGRAFNVVVAKSFYDNVEKTLEFPLWRHKKVGNV